MPIYVYEPTVWSESEEVLDCCFFETLQSIKDAPLKNCPTCGHAIHRAVTTFSVTSSVSQQSNSQNAESMYSVLDTKKDSPAKRAARLAMRHVCSMGCKH